jgi:hypothetical protein
VHEHVARPQKLGHPLGEAEDAHPWVIGETTPQRVLRDRVASGDDDDVCGARGERFLGRALQVPDAPSTARHHGHAAVEAKAERAPGVSRRGCLEEAAAHDRPDVRCARAARDTLDALDRTRMGDEVQVDARMAPEREVGQIGDRRADGHIELPAPAHPSEHARERRVRGHDDVRPVAAHERRIRRRPATLSAHEPMIRAGARWAPSR